MKNLTRKLGMFMLVLVLALCPVLMFTGCQISGGDNNNSGVTDDTNKNDDNKNNDKNNDDNNDSGSETPNKTLTLAQAEAVLKSMIVVFDSTNPADTTKYANIPSYKETYAKRVGEGDTVNPDAEVDSSSWVRINNEGGKIQSLGKSYNGLEETAMFIYGGKYYNYIKSPSDSTGRANERTASDYYSLFVSSAECSYITNGEDDIWAEIGLVGNAAEEDGVTVTKSYSNNENVYTITYTAVFNPEERLAPAIGSGNITYMDSTTATYSITFDATAKRLIKITESRKTTKVYTSAGQLSATKTVDVGDVAKDWLYITYNYEYNLTDAFTIPQSYIDAIQ